MKYIDAAEVERLAEEWSRLSDQIGNGNTVAALRECSRELRSLLAAAKPMPWTCKGRLRVAIDCEFNGKGGELISMALVAEDGREFYEVVRIPEAPDPWVAANVLPILNKQPAGKALFQAKLRAFLAELGDPLIVSDWPVDIAYLCEWVIVGEYPMCTAPMIHAVSMSLPNTPASAIPHNALEDARAICKALPAVKDSLTVQPMPEPTEDEVEACAEAYCDAYLASGSISEWTDSGVRACLARFVEMRNEK